MNKLKIIALSGVAQSGKDSFFRFATNFLHEKGLSTERFSFADELKKDLDSFIQDKFGFSAMTEISEEKNKIRPLMVEYGKIRRKESKGRHWIDQIRPKLLAESGAHVRFITDLRFAEFGAGDELGFVHEIGGKVIHIERIEGKTWLGDWWPKEPANDEERKNDPIIKRAADVKFSWWDFMGGNEKLAQERVNEVLEQNEQLWKF